MSVVSGDGRGKLTQTAGTAIAFVTSARKDCWTQWDYMSYTNLATAHTVTCMRGVGPRLKLTEAVTASDTTWKVDSAPVDGGGNAVASGDYIAIELDDGSWLLDTVASLSSLTITVNTGTGATQTAGVGNRVVVFGVIGDTVHDNSDFAVAASATTTFAANTLGGALHRSRFGEPLCFYDGNATNAGTINYASWTFAK